MSNDCRSPRLSALWDLLINPSAVSEATPDADRLPLNDLLPLDDLLPPSDPLFWGNLGAVTDCISKLGFPTSDDSQSSTALPCPNPTTSTNDTPVSLREGQSICTVGVNGTFAWSDILNASADTLVALNENEDLITAVLKSAGALEPENLQKDTEEVITTAISLLDHPAQPTPPIAEYLLQNSDSTSVNAAGQLSVQQLLAMFPLPSALLPSVSQPIAAATDGVSINAIDKIVPEDIPKQPIAVVPPASNDHTFRDVDNTLPATPDANSQASSSIIPPQAKAVKTKKSSKGKGNAKENAEVVPKASSSGTSNKRRHDDTEDTTKMPSDAPSKKPCPIYDETIHPLPEDTMHPRTAGHQPRGRWLCVDKHGNRLSANFTDSVQGNIDGVIYTANPADSTTWGVKRIPRNKADNICYVCVICNRPFRPKKEGPRAIVDHWVRTHCKPGVRFKCPAYPCEYDSNEQHPVARHILGDGGYGGQLGCRMGTAFLPVSFVENWAVEIRARAKERLLEDVVGLLSQGKLTLEDVQRDFIHALSDST